MNERDKQVLSNIHSRIRSILNYCEKCFSLNDFQSDSMRVEACVFNLMQVGELAKTSLSDECKAEIKNIPWVQICGMRNRIIHKYSGVNLSIVWNMIYEDLPALKDEIAVFL